jgi:hypothetical protein
MVNILQIWNKNRNQQYKRLVLIYKLFDQKTKRIYGLPNSLRSVFAAPLVFSYIFHLISLRFFSLIFDFVALAIGRIRFFDKSLIKVSGTLPVNKQKCRVLLVYAKKCNFSEFDFHLAETFFNKFEGHKTIVINCDCKNIEKIHSLGMQPDYQLVKPNWGYDFDGYAGIVEKFKDYDFSTLTFLNNSVVAITSDSNWVDKMEKRALDIDGIVGLVQSLSPIKHFQSFAFTISRTALTAPLIKWFSRIRPLKRKQAIVRFYELGFAKKIKDLKIKSSYIFEFSNVMEISRESWKVKLGVYADTQIYRTIYARTSLGLGVNPTHHHWRFLIDFGIPLIKKELIISNPEELPDILDYLSTNHPELIPLRNNSLTI